MLKKSNIIVLDQVHYLSEFLGDIPYTLLLYKKEQAFNA